LIIENFQNILPSSPALAMKGEVAEKIDFFKTEFQPNQSKIQQGMLFSCMLLYLYYMRY
jgi:hypothetical protein